mgnify:CR=1 FL=1
MSVLQNLFISIFKMSITASYVAIGVIFIRMFLKKCRRFFPIFFGFWCFSAFYAPFLLIRL